MIPVYLILGFLDGGKTTFMKDTLEDSEFLDGEKTLLLVCEEGEEEYDLKALEAKKVSTVFVDNFEDLTVDYMKELTRTYGPEKVMIEYNGTWSVSQFLMGEKPKNWEIAQIITVADATTFETYMSNMRQMMAEQLNFTELVVFNRCNAGTKKNTFRKLVKTLNKRAQIVFEAADGETGFDDEIELPYDMNADIIDIEDDDYGIFYIDALDDPKKYEGKTVRFLAMVYRGKETPKGTFVPGRFAMTCCANDMSFIGFLCHGEQANYFKMREWVKVTATIKSEYQKEYEGEGPVLYLKDIAPAEKPKDHVVYMN